MGLEVRRLVVTSVIWQLRMLVSFWNFQTYKFRLQVKVGGSNLELKVFDQASCLLWICLGSLPRIEDPLDIG